jgi:hypothetical protein
MRYSQGVRAAWLLSVLCFFGFLSHAFGLGQTAYVETDESSGSFAIARDNFAAKLYVDSHDFAGVIRAAGDLQADVARVTGVKPKLLHRKDRVAGDTIIIGTLGHSELIDALVSAHKLDASSIAGKWESFLTEVVADPCPGVSNALVIVGSDKRGTIYGIYDLSEQMGVSPWYYWGDVPVEHKPALFVKAGTFEQGPPSVKYRGIFLNDESPDLTHWIQAKYGKVNVPGGPRDVADYGRRFYTKLFELILRLKGNYLWPAMWNNRFNMDDPGDPRLADEYGIVMGTSHQEPMLRAQKEWDWGRRYGKKYKNWSYANTNQQPVLQQFWREGVRRNKNYENIYTMGLRAENDAGTPIGKDLTAKIVDVQRGILAQEINPDLTKIPQVWCLYKEVQGFYNEGMRVPDDVTLLWAEDNWGDVRRLPTAAERERSGGAGIYYHFDYHGSPRSYQWINTSPIPKIWDQMSLAREYGADRIWIVNVGHFKGYEFPMDYFLNLAWNTGRWTNSSMTEFTRLWAVREFGPEFADDIADVIAKSTKYEGRRKPELVDAHTYSLDHYDEAERVAAEFETVNNKALEIFDQLPPEKKNAFYELVYFPIKAAAQLDELYLAAEKNTAYAEEGRASANDMAALVHQLFDQHMDLMHYFNTGFAHGKWDHFMDQTHIGYTSWRDPIHDSLDAIKLKQIDVPAAAAMGIALDGGDANSLPQFDNFNQQRCYIEIFDKGKAKFDFTASASEPWIKLSESGGTVEKDKRLWVNMDWSKVPQGKSAGTVQISGVGTNFNVNVEAFNPPDISRESLHGFVEGDGVVSIEPEHFAKNTDAGGNRWIKIEDYGRTLSGMRATGPVDAPEAAPGKDSPCLEYPMYLFDSGKVELNTITSPTLNFMPGRALRFAASIDDATPTVATLVPAKYNAQNGNRDWETTVMDNARTAKTSFTLTKAGYHTLKIWMIDPGVVVQKIVVDLGGLKTSYLGPPESYRN